MTDESWSWPEQRWRAAVERVRAGRPLRPEQWPRDARVAVALSFDSDHETTALRTGDVHPGGVSPAAPGGGSGLYGRGSRGRPARLDPRVERGPAARRRGRPAGPQRGRARAAVRPPA